MNKEPIHNRRQTRRLVTAAVIAALYVVMTLPFAQFAFGPIQFRLAESMSFLPMIIPAAIPGLTIGCFLANLLNPGNLGPIDIIFGSLATLISALLTRLIYKRSLMKNLSLKSLIALIPPVLVNAIVVGTYLTFLLTNEEIFLTMILMNIVYVGLSQIVVVYIIGYPLMLLLRKTKVLKTEQEE